MGVTGHFGQKIKSLKALKVHKSLIKIDKIWTISWLFSNK